MKAVIPTLLVALALAPTMGRAVIVTDTTVTIDVTNPNWQPSGIHVARGEMVYMLGYAAGYWRGGSAGPHVIDDIMQEAWQYGDPAASPAPGLGYGIVYRIGGGDPMGVPQSRMFVVGGDTGEIEFGYNDVNHGDNWGIAICGVIIPREEDTLSVLERRPLARQSVRVSALPNPARGSAAFKLNVPMATMVGVSVYDATGAEVSVFEHACHAGVNSVVWDGSDNNGRRLAQGSYFIKAWDGSGVLCEGKVVLTE